MNFWVCLDYLDFINWGEKNCPLWVAPFLRQQILHLEVENARWTPACTQWSFFLSSEGMATSSPWFPDLSSTMDLELWIPVLQRLKLELKSLGLTWPMSFFVTYLYHSWLIYSTILLAIATRTCTSYIRKACAFSITSFHFPNTSSQQAPFSSVLLSGWCYPPANT